MITCSVGKYKFIFKLGPCNDDKNEYEYVYYVSFDPNHYKADVRAIITSIS